MSFYYLILLFSAVPNHPWFGSDLGGITFFKITGAICTIYAIFHLTVRKSYPGFLSTWPARFFIILFLWAVTSFVFRDFSEGMTTTAIGTYTSALFLFFVTLTVIDSPSRFRMAVFSVIGGMGIASLYTVREWEKAGFSFYRPGYVAGDANYYAAVSLLTLPVSYYLAREKGPLWERTFCWGCLMITVLGFVSAASRGALIGLSLAGVFMLIRSERRFGLAILVGLFVIVMLFAPISPLMRLLHPERGDDASVRIHKALLAAGLDMVRQNPFFGVGLGNFRARVAELVVRGDPNAPPNAYIAHNTYLEYAAEMGIPASLVFLGILISTFRLLEKVRRSAAKIFFRRVALGWQAGIIGFAGAAFFISAEYVKPFWCVVFMCCTMPSLLVIKESAGRIPREIKELRLEPGFGFWPVQKAEGVVVRGHYR